MPDSDNIFPTRPLNLKYTVIPENGLKFAELYRDAVKRFDNIDLDYSVESINFVDSFLQRFKDENFTVNDFAETIICKSK